MRLTLTPPRRRVVEPDSAPTQVEATVVVVTKDRVGDARRAVKSATKQSGNVEVIVIDDASADGTAEEIAGEFPEARVQRADSSQGYIAQRNKAARLARGEIIVSLDDDAQFSSTETIQSLLEEFADPRVGAVAMPYIDVGFGTGVLQARPEPDRMFLTHTFRGTAYAVRRELFLKLGGFRETLYYQWEEPDFCARLMDAGYLVVLGGTPPILHHESQKRNYDKMLYWGRRNYLLVSWWNVPTRYLPGRLLKVWTHGVVLAWKSRRFKPTLSGLARGCIDAYRTRAYRRPVSPAVHRQMRRLLKAGPQPIGSARRDSPR